MSSYFFVFPEIHGKPVYDNKQSFRLTRFALAGSKIKLECVAQGTQPIVYRWTRNGKPLTRTKYKAYGPVLKIDKLILHDAGNYTCVASNVFGSSNCSYEIRVYGLYLLFNLFYHYFIVFTTILTSYVAVV